MKRITLLILTFFVAANIMAQNASISGKLSIENPSSIIASLTHVVGNQVLPVDTIQLDKKGKFSFSLKVEQPSLYLLTFSGMEKNIVHLMMEPNDEVSIDVRKDKELNFLEIVESKGSNNVQLYKEFNNILYKYAKQISGLNAEYLSPNTSNDRKQALGAEMQQIQISQNIDVSKLLSSNTGVLMSAFIATYFDNNIETYIELYENIDNALKVKYADNQFVQYIESRIKSSLTPGRMAPEIAMKDPDGKERKLSDLRGSIVMIDFWASWCRPCRMENPNVVKLYHKYHSKGFEIYSVSLDKNRADWVRAISQDGLEWPNHVSDLNGWTSSGGAAYGIMSVPSTVLVDREGRIIARNLRGQELANKLKEIFGE